MAYAYSHLYRLPTEDALERSAVKKLLPMQEGDVQATHADVGAEAGNRHPCGGMRFVAWYRDHYRISDH
jgi:UDP-glucuronate 4-epimerase